MKALKNYIDGAWLDGSAPKQRLVNPARREEGVSEAPLSSAAEVESAMSAASRALADWSGAPGPQRAALLEAAVRLMESREDEFALTITLENGKTLRESRAEFRSALKEALFQIGQGRRSAGRFGASEQSGAVCYLDRRPLGVVSLITPWSFPLKVLCRKIFPALVAGNCCVVKPSQWTPASAVLLFEAMAEAGLPPGVNNLVIGQGSVIGDTMVTHPAVKAVSFTGSTEVGVNIAQKCAGSGTRLQLEMGGKNPLVALADADLHELVEAVTVGAFGCAGQSCASTSRVIVEAPIYDEFLERFTARVNDIVVGDGRDPETDMGPVAGDQQYQGILRYIELGRREGARLCQGGHPLCDGDLAKGCFIAPTIFADVASRMRIAREEIFGPVVSVFKAKDFEEALSMANDTVYGLSSSIFTNDLAKAQRFVQESHVGLCHVNMPTEWTEPHLEFGGVKESGRGAPEAGESGTQFFTAHKAVYLRHE